jgi:MerR family transcriptional regulator, light-induced transcriptional regulator
MIPSSRYDEYLEALLRGERSTCADIVRHLLAAEVPVRTLYTRLFQPALYQVGELWETNQVSVATEHLATAITEGLLHLVYPLLFGGPRLGKSAVISCTPNEYHQLGGKMVADCFELLGWRGYFLGANTPVQDLIAFVHARQPDAVALSLAVYFNLPALLEAATAIRSEFPRLPVLVGGQAFRAGGRGRVEQVPGVCHLASLDELESWIQSTSGHGV